MEFLVVIVIVLLLALLFKSPKAARAKGLFTRRCPHCRQIIPSRASACFHCTNDVEPHRWIWEKPKTATRIRVATEGSSTNTSQPK
jgi:hypothetical protein